MLSLALESTGIPVANNTLLLVTGAMASMHHLNIWILAVVALAGSIMGACTAYTIGLRGGQRVIIRLATFFHIDNEKVRMTERWFQKSGIGMIFLSRLTPYVRPFACFPAGIARMPFLRFFFAAFTGSLLWCAILLYFGWSLGRRWTLALHLIQNYTLPTVGGLLLLIACYLLLLSFVKRRVKKYTSIETTHAVCQEQADNELLHI